MTPAPISVERLRELLDKATPGPWDVFRDGSDRLYVSGGNGPIAWVNDVDPEAGDAHADLIAALPTLLHQLAETKGQSDRLCGKYLAALSRAESAERAREEWRDRFIHVSAMRYMDNGLMHDKAHEAAEKDAAFLAASGGDNESR